MYKGKRFMAMLLSLVMIFQVLPINVLAAVTIRSGVLYGITPYEVTYIMANDADDMEQVEGNIFKAKREGSTIVPQLINPDATNVKPDIPDIAGYKTLGWEPSVPATATGNATYYATYRKLNTYSVTVEFKYATGGEVRKTQVYEFEEGTDETLTVEVIQLDGFALSVTGDLEENVAVYSDSVLMVYVKALNGNKHFVAEYTGEEVNYTVNHHVEQIDGTEQVTTESKQGIAGSQTQAAVLDQDWTGFTVPANESIEQKTISPDGDTVIDIYYDRNTYKLTYVTGQNATYVDNVMARM